ncbi:hypothetical protein DPMN_074411 [Dreissena polymorpha]|uniref:Poly [ADP-ribose] polymerase n=1 Tax=Dreissena polymorpha TaxID=45954 RepID=A0A9D3YIE5_DREPO|nr:hypothetical protein DPMN_074411 [Dreissena polymorpha]
MKVTKIKRLQNKRLLERFKAEIEDVRRHISEDDDVTVKYLYHGTSADKAKLCEEGLDQRLSRMGYFGKGIYFSDTPLKCVHYADDPGRSNPDEAYILKCRVILGDVKVYPHGTNDISLKREPEKEDTYSGWRYYDSVKGCPKDFNEYVVYESRRALIEYIITFQVNKDLVAKLRSKSLKNSSKPVCAAPSTPAKQSVIFRTNQSVIPSTQSRMTAGQNAEHNFHTNHIERNLTDRIPRYGQMPNTPDTEHSRRIQEVRETVRLKRSIESTNQTGLQVQAESASQQQQQQLQQQLWPVDDVDSEMNDLLTRPLSRSEVSLKSQSSHAEVFDGPPAPPRQRDPKTRDEARSGQQVLDLCIHEFMNVTNMEDSNRARYFVQRADMDVNKAISLYYEEM